MAGETGQLRYATFLTVLIFSALVLAARLTYSFLADGQHFPIVTVKVIANYEHITRAQLSAVLSKYRDASFFSLPVKQVRQDLIDIPWSDSVTVERIWPDTLKIVLTEKEPIALWNNDLMNSLGEVFQVGQTIDAPQLPRLMGPEHQQTEVLQNYQKLSTLLSVYGLQAASLKLRDNQAWELVLTNGVELHLGKRDLEKRLLRFCKAYPAVFAEKVSDLSSVDLRYARGMAAKWKHGS